MENEVDWDSFRSLDDVPEALVAEIPEHVFARFAGYQGVCEGEEPGLPGQSTRVQAMVELLRSHPIEMAWFCRDHVIERMTAREAEQAKETP